MRWLALLGVLGGGAVVAAASCGGEEFHSFPPGDGGGGNTGGSTTTGGGGSGGTSMNCVDGDSDGVTDCEGDCDDTNANVFPGAPEICGDGVDNACGNDPDPTATCGGIGTYVSEAIGNDANPGTQAEPVATINEGMNKAVQLGMAQPVFVAEGQYPEDVTLQEGVDLWGGYSCNSMADCSWLRDPALFVATIENQDADGIYVDHTVTNATEVDGFTVLGLGGNPGNGNSYSAFFVQGAPIIRNNRIVSGDITGCSQCNTRGIAMDGAPSANTNALIESNVIEGGSSGATTIGISITNGAVVDISGNDIIGGQGTWTRCIAIAGAIGAVNITNNDMNAGSCNGNNTTFAIFMGAGVSPLVDSNRINTDASKLGTCPGFTGNWWTGGIESEGSTATISNNVINGVASPRSTAVMLADCEGNCQLGQAVVMNNTLEGGGQAVSAGNSSISAAIVFKGFKPNQNVVVGRVRNNVLVAGAGMLAFAGYEDVGQVGSTARPQEFDNNALYKSTMLYQAWNGTTAVPLATIALVNSTVNGANNNIGTDCQVDATGHLMAGSPCIDQGTQSGGETPQWDMDGETRPQGSEADIGADEAG